MVFLQHKLYSFLHWISTDHYWVFYHGSWRSQQFSKPYTCSNHAVYRLYCRYSCSVDLPEKIPGILIIGIVVQLVRTPACQAGGRGFESLRSRSLKPRFLVERPGFFVALLYFPDMTVNDTNRPFLK